MVPVGSNGDFYRSFLKNIRDQNHTLLQSVCQTTEFLYKMLWFLRGRDLDVDLQKRSNIWDLFPDYFLFHRPMFVLESLEWK